MSSILCIEDNAEMQILVEAALDSHRVTVVSTLAEAKKSLSQTKFDLVILDLELPDGDGMKFLASLNSSEPAVPVFILTGKSETANKVIAFSLGVDDFISKPFDPLELRARVNAKLKKVAAVSDQQAVMKLKDLTIDVEKQRVTISGKSGQDFVTLTSLEFRLLLTFARSPDRVFSRAKLLDSVWGSDIAVTDRTVDTHVGHLRKKIAASSVKIETVLNEGYRLVA
ncbi:MAG: response regulator transcription factor [Proteobacteria bacterium]|nr:MAG: response regulator transcription factor [Pseudomonadota bacterium]